MSLNTRQEISRHAILVADSDAATRSQTATVLDACGHKTTQAVDITDALEMLEKQEFEAAIVASDSGRHDVFDFLRTASAKVPPVPVVVLADFDSVQNAVEAMKLGAVDYVVKPADERDIQTSILQALERRRMLVGGAPDATEEVTGFGGLLGSSDVMVEIHDQIRRVAPYRSTVLITGESGTGKELVARAIHALSGASSGPFMAINCSALPSDLVESQLFGNEKGAFTGATASRKGLIEAADGGTLFLDEIGELPLDSQGKLLRVIEDRQVLPVGSTRAIPVSIRLLAATNSDLEEGVREHRFREDLYYRLNVLAIDLPPLRFRREDVPLLAQIFLDRFAEENASPQKDLSPEVEQKLQAYPWPGNVRELKNIAERLAVFAPGPIVRVEHLPPHVRNFGHPPLPVSSGSPGADAFDGMTLEQIERFIIERTLGRTGGNRSRAAQALGISLRTLQRKLKEYGAGPGATGPLDA